MAEEQTDTAQMKISFTLEDEDAALTAAKLELLKEEDGTLLSVSSQKVDAGFQQVWLDLEENTPYTLSITATQALGLCSQQQKITEEVCR